jgi:hypothetical protein
METKAVATRWILGLALLCSTCGRTPLLPPYCHVDVDPAAIDFGSGLPGSTTTRSVRVSNSGGAACQLSGIHVSSDPAGWFAISPSTSETVVVPPLMSVELGVSFTPNLVTAPLTRTAQLVFASNAPDKAQASISLTGTVKSTCTLQVTPSTIDFGMVSIGGSPTSQVTVTNHGTGPCLVGDLGITPDSDRLFYLSSPLSTALTLMPEQTSTVVVGFDASSRQLPRHRTGALGMISNDADHPAPRVPLSADLDIGCALTWTPTRLDFGNVILNNQTNANLTVKNDGTRACEVSGIAITVDSDPDFKLRDTQALSLSVAAGASATIAVTFTAADSAPPHGKSGTLVFQTGDAQNPRGQVPLFGYVSTVCIEASRWVYTVDTSGTLSRFDPSTLTFTDITRLACPGESAGPNSMAVDQNAVAWVNFDDGNLFKVDTGTGKCEATGIGPNQGPYKLMGMGFVFDSSTGTDRLYISGSPNNLSTQSTLATLDFPSLTITPVGPAAAGNVELTGTGDGELWGFAPAAAASNGQPVLVRLDPATGKTLESHTYPSLTTSGSRTTWAVKFWGGSFWIFLSGSVFEVSRDNLDTFRTALGNTGRYVVGAGVSTCAPLQ